MLVSSTIRGAWSVEAEFGITETCGYEPTRSHKIIRSGALLDD